MLVFDNNESKKGGDSKQSLSRLTIVRREVPSSKKITLANKKFLISLGLELQKKNKKK